MSISVPNAGTDFALVTDNLTIVSIAQIDPDSGSTLQTASSVVCLQPEESVLDLEIGQGEVGTQTSSFWIEAASVQTGGTAWTPKERDQITDAAGITWVIDSVRLLAFGTMLQMTGVLLQ